MTTRDGSNISSSNLAKKSLSEGKPATIGAPGTRVQAPGWKPITPRRSSSRFKMEVFQNTAPTFMIFLSSVYTDRGISGEVSTMVVTASKNGGAFSNITSGVTIADRGNGWYSVTLSTVHTDTLGTLAFHVTSLNTYPNDETILKVIDLAQGLFPTGSVVTDGSNSVVSFKTDLVQVTLDYWRDAFLVMTSGNFKEQVKKITTYNGTTRFITVATPGFTGTPAGGDTFYLINK